MNNIADIYKAKVIEKREQHFCSRKRLVAPLSTIHAYCRDIDKILRAIYARCIDIRKPDKDFCLIALGGYGRKELWPYSDVDILILHENQHRSVKLTSFIRILWNIGLTLGCVVRTLAESKAILGKDLATDTALLECRYLCGNHDLFNKLQYKYIRPHFAKDKKFYLEELSASLREGLYSAENSLYRVEPNIKNGICTLRDCQRLLWAERIRTGAAKFADLHTKSGFSLAETKRFLANYTFLAGIRTELHLSGRMRIDVLETGMQNKIADTYGLTSNGAATLMEIFFKTVRDIRHLLLSFLEKDLSGKSIWHNVRIRMSALEIAPGIGLLDGIIFPLRKKNIRLETSYQIIQLFYIALTYQATFSVDMRNKIHRAISTIDPDDYKTKSVGDIFLSILAWPDSIGRILLMMQESGLLGKMIPPFDSLTCKVEYDQYHEFTMDQHILLAISACDDLTHDEDAKIRNTYQSIKDRLILRLAILLHDIGKVQEGDHAQNGAVITENICERLGLTEKQSEEVRFLVYHHLDMSNLSLQREPDSNNIMIFARELSSQRMLDMLYILTIVDIRSVGPKTWTGWKAYQLEQLYDRVIQALLQPEERSDASAVMVVPAIPDPSYLHDTLPEDRIKHRQWLKEVEDNKFQLYNESFTGFERLTVCSYDRAGFLSDVIGCISSEGYNVLSARIYSTPDGKVLDIFHVEPPEKPRIATTKRINNIYRKWKLIESRQTNADKLVLERIATYPPPALRLSQQISAIEVKVNNNDSQLYTIIEIDTADNFGLLHKITRCFHEKNVNIISAHLSTRNDRAMDVFYVNDTTERKIIAQDAIDQLRSTLVDTLRNNNGKLE
jgi:[protein-PII] uridylyltransferase